MIHAFMRGERGGWSRVIVRGTRLFSVLVHNRGRTLTCDALIALMWGDTYRGERQRLHGYIHRLRHKLGEDSRSPRYFWTAPCLGYRFDPPALGCGQDSFYVCKIDHKACIFF